MRRTGLQSLPCIALVLVTAIVTEALGGATPLTTVRVASGLARPVYVTAPRGDTSRLFIVEQRSGTTGRIRILQLPSHTLLATPYLSITPVLTGNEEGLLGLAFHPDFLSNGYFWVYYTNSAGNNQIVRYQANAPFDSSTTANAASATQVITFSHPGNTNHNGGWIAFGPDGYLYVGTGDGGSANDPPGNAQNINSLLGKMLRLDVDGLDNIPGNGDDDAFPGDATLLYSNPPTNPFVGVAGLDEIWSIGIRNPWRNSFDRETGDLYIADVGQNAIEEIDFQAAGMAPNPVRNYGWRCMEGFTCTGLTGCTCNAASLTMPIHTYSHAGGNCSVTGGYVYRGCAMPDMHGIYFFADYCSAQIWSFSYSGIGPAPAPTNRTAELAPGGGLSIATITAFGEDARGEIYICDQGGEVFKIIPAGPTDPIGACCTAGACAQLTENDCLAQSGVYLGDCLDCAAVVCPEACCFSDGSCQDLTSGQCLLGGGTAQGAGTSCLTAVCTQPPVACCMPDGTCQNVTSDQCRTLGGESGDAGSACAGDLDGNGIDDFCQDEPCGECGPGPHWIDSPLCPPGRDHVPTGAVVGVDLTLDGIVDTNLVLTGPSSIERVGPSDDSAVFPGTRPVDGHTDVIDTEMIGMTLTGGGASLIAGQGRGTIPLAASHGNIAEQPSDPNLADSFFDVFFEIDLGGGNRLYNQSPLRVQSVINCIPPQATYHHLILPGGIPLYTSPTPGQGAHVANLVTANHTTFPAGIPSATALSALSRKPNPNPSAGGVCDTPTHPVIGTEPHQGGITQLRVNFDVPPGAPTGAEIMANLQQATCPLPGYAPYAGAAAASPSVIGSTLVVDFTPGLENARKYRVILPPSVTSLAGQSVQVRALLGDVNGDQSVNALDRSVAVGAWTGPGGFTCPTDVNSSGQTNALDRSVVVGAWTGGIATNCVP